MITWLVEIRIFLILDNYSYYYNRNAITYHSVGISIYERGGGDEKGVKSERERRGGEEHRPMSIIKIPVEKRRWVSTRGMYIPLARRRSINCRIMNEVNRQLDECRATTGSSSYLLSPPPPRRCGTTPPLYHYMTS